ncbi:Sec-independent protein translocase protein TatB [Erythrobacter sp. JK5]|uniref:Sec-independent protein translocase protein TatB n=1 Tax=Erythrobacter sp. JK5 TaxID=2829500 RepID=UPI001BA7B105|nr:Sec-independent protein translocase protein TatB [Erythrobacter sp. JK5]QUL36583.1 twin-arginine translocase subunit TatB [Erythrobacter sp. JK5]
MFDIGAAELLVIVIVAILVIGPKDMPLAMRTAGRWIGKIRKVSAHFRTGIDAMVREAELEDMEKKWKAQNEEIMRRTTLSGNDATGEPAMTGPPPGPERSSPDDAGVPDPMADDPAPSAPPASPDPSPELPLPQRGGTDRPGE